VKTLGKILLIPFLLAGYITTVTPLIATFSDFGLLGIKSAPSPWYYLGIVSLLTIPLLILHFLLLKLSLKTKPGILRFCTYLLILQLIPFILGFSGACIETYIAKSSGLKAAQILEKYADTHNRSFPPASEIHSLNLPPRVSYHPLGTKNFSLQIKGFTSPYNGFDLIYSKNTGFTFTD